MTASPQENRARLESLRALVEERFPTRRASQKRRRSTGLPAIDGERGGLLTGAVTEITGSTSGAQLVLAAILEAAVREAFHVGLIDGTTEFSPEDWPQRQLSRLLWVRCQDAERAVRAADLLVRDGNLPFLVLDLQGMSPREIARIPANTWHRFHRVMESHPGVLLVLTPRPLVEGAASRIAVEPATQLESRLEERTELIRKLRALVYERGYAEPTPLARSA